MKANFMIRSMAVLAVLIACLTGCSGSSDDQIIPVDLTDMDERLILELEAHDVWYRRVGSNTIEVKKSDAKQVMEIIEKSSTARPQLDRASISDNRFQPIIKRRFEEQEIAFKVVCYHGMEFLVWDGRAELEVEAIVKQVSEEYAEPVAWEDEDGSLLQPATCAEDSSRVRSGSLTRRVSHDIVVADEKATELNETDLNQDRPTLEHGLDLSEMARLMDSLELLYDEGVFSSGASADLQNLRCTPSICQFSVPLEDFHQTPFTNAWRSDDGIGAMDFPQLYGVRDVENPDIWHIFLARPSIDQYRGEILDQMNQSVSGN